MQQSIQNIIRKSRKLIDAGNLEKAEKLLRKANRNAPNQPDVLHHLGIIAINCGSTNQAIDIYTELLRIRPNNAIYLYNLGLSYLRSGQFGPAAEHLRIAIKLDPNLKAAYSDLCLALTKINNNEDAIKYGKLAVQHSPNNAAAHYNLALAFDNNMNFSAALPHYERAAQLLPDHPGILLDLAKAYNDQGNTGLARKYYLKVLQIIPNHAHTYRNLVRITKYTSPDHSDVLRLKSLLSNDQISDDDRTDIFFALGKIHQDCCLYDEAFSYFNRGNEIQDQKHNFIPDDFSQFISSMIDICETELIRDKLKYGNVSETPVFVIGTPRSGTSLVEQIISSHPDAFGAGELDYIYKAANSLPGRLNTKSLFPHCLPDISSNMIDELASAYLRYTRSLTNGERIIVDKMPGNFQYLAFIHILFPNAKFVHCQRDPRDACISMFTEYFPMGVPYSYDLFKLGRYYSQYQRIMEHWRCVLPDSCILDLQYETLVNNQEDITRHLLDFIGLDWNDECLEFYKTKRRVITASDTQVTRPMYSSSIGRWKHYDRFIEPLERGFSYDSSS